MFTIAKGRVGPITERYLNGSFKSVVQENENGIRRVKILGMDCSHSGDYKVGYASDPLITIKAEEGVTHDELRTALEELGVWKMLNLTPIECPSGDSWTNGFKTMPNTLTSVERLYEKCEEMVDDHELLGEPQQFSVYL